MIASLKGELFLKSPERIIVDVHGVGYEVFVSMNSLHDLPAVGQDVFLYIHTNVREDAITLFGFLDSDEKAMFLLLTSVSGVGPKLALAILSGIKPAGLARAVVAKDLKTLTALSGVGKKTAERLCLDLKDKVPFVVSGKGFSDEEEVAADLDDADRQIRDVVSVLVNLGYPQSRAQEAVIKTRKRLPVDAFAAMKIEEILRETLRSLA